MARGDPEARTINLSGEAMRLLIDVQTKLAADLGFVPTMTQVIQHLCRTRN